MMAKKKDNTEVYFKVGMALLGMALLTAIILFIMMTIWI